MLEKTFLATKDDLTQFYKYSLRRNFSLSFILVTGFSFAFLISRFFFDVSQLQLLIFPSFMILVLAFILITPNLFATRVLKQNVHFKHEITITISEEGVTQKAYGGFSSLKWEDLYETQETKTLFLLFIMQNQAYLFPKRLLSAEEIEQVSDLLIKKVPRRKKHWLKKLENIFIIILLIIMVLSIICLAVLKLFY